MNRLLIATDAWHPQINGVVRTFEHMVEEPDPGRDIVGARPVEIDDCLDSGLFRGALDGSGTGHGITGLIVATGGGHGRARRWNSCYGACMTRAEAIAKINTSLATPECTR